MLVHKLDIIGVTETFLDDSVHDSRILPLGYVTYQKDCDRHVFGQERYCHSIHCNDLETDREIV